VREQVLQFPDRAKLFARHEFAGGRDRLRVLDVTPVAQSVEIFERESDRIHPFVTGAAEFVRAVHGQHFAERRVVALERFFGGLEIRDVRRRRGRRGAKNIFEHEKPRFTGEVRVGFDVTVSTVPCVSTPPRGLSGGRVTRRQRIAFTPGTP